MKRNIILSYIVSVLLCSAGCTNGHSVSEESVSLYLSGKESYAAGDFEKGERLFSHAAEISPDFYQARFMQGKSLYFGNKADKAEELLLRLLNDYPEYREAEQFYIRICISLGKQEEAKVRTEQLLSYDSADPRLLYLRSILYQEDDDLSGSLEYLHKAALYSEEFARVFLDLGRVYYIFGMLDSAEENINKSLTLLPDESLLTQPVKKLLTKIGEEDEK